MYKVNQIVKYKCPYKLNSKGKITAKFKIIDTKDGCYIGGYCYLISSDPILQHDLVVENDIIEVVKNEKRK